MKEASRKLLEKAQESIEAAAILKREGQNTFAASRVYYAMYYVTEALLYEKGLKFKKHSAVHSAFGEQFVKTGIFDSKFYKALTKAFENRLISDYDIDVAIPREEVELMIEQADSFLRTTSQYLTKTNS